MRSQNKKFMIGLENSMLHHLMISHESFCRIFWGWNCSFNDFFLSTECRKKCETYSTTKTFIRYCLCIPVTLLCSHNLYFFTPIDYLFLLRWLPLWDSLAAIDDTEWPTSAFWRVTLYLQIHRSALKFSEKNRYIMNNRDRLKRLTFKGTLYWISVLSCVESCVLTVHVILTRHSCISVFSNWIMSFRQNNHGFLAIFFLHY